MKNKYVWIGPRQSDIDDDDFFDTSITTYGENKYSYYRNDKQRHSRGSNDEILFIENAIRELDSINPSYRYIFYDQSEISRLKKECTKKIIGDNEQPVINILNSKEFTRSWLSNDINCLPFIVMPFADTNYNSICRIFPGVYSFIIQNIYGVGGTKTHLVHNLKELEIVKAKYKPYEVSIISPYISNAISLNIHIICCKNGGILFPYSEQIINQHEHCLLYSGSDFTNTNNTCISVQIREATNVIMNKLIMLGYRGIAGIDFIWANDILYFIEINPRFQGSTRILNLWLKQHNCQSIYKMHLDACLGKTSNYSFEHETVPFISHNHIYGANNTLTLSNDYTLAFQDMDGWNPKSECSENVYMFRNIYTLNQ